MKKLMLGAGIFSLVMGITGCSNDDIENDVSSELLTGRIQIDDEQTLLGNILTVPVVTVGQDSWLVAVAAAEKWSNNFIALPVLVEKGTFYNVQLIFDDAVVNFDKQHARIVLKLYAENQNGGIPGAWDVSDKPITLANNVLVMKAITIYADLTNYNPFRHSFDLNGDGTLDFNEFLRTYPNNFDDAWDTSNDGYLDREEFYNATFFNADLNWDNEISRTEWNEGILRMFGNWANNNFSIFDGDKNNSLNREEWYKIFEESGWFEAYDADSNNRVTRMELNEGLFKDWDLNDDGKIDEAEFNMYRPYVIEWWDMWN